MFLKIFSRSSCVRALERDDQRLGLHLAQQRLDAAVVELEQVLEHEHLVDDLLREVGVVLAHCVDAPRSPASLPMKFRISAAVRTPPSG